jgi:hypothetical protein
MKDEDRLLLTFGWATLLIGIILLVCKVTYRMDQIDKKLDGISASITASLTDATMTDAHTVTDATPKEPGDDEIVMSIRPELLDTSEETLEASETILEDEPKQIDLEESKSVPEASEKSESVIYTESTPTDAPVISGGLTKSCGVYQGPSGKETYYNLDMSGVVSIMRGIGYSEAEYPYWIREDGVKMLGNYVMVAANFNIRPRGTVIETSLGTGLVCDTGSFASYNSSQLDIAVSW